MPGLVALSQAMLVCFSMPLTCCTICHASSATTGNLRGALRDLPPFPLQQLTPANPAAADAWQQHLQQPLQPANRAYTSPHLRHIQQHDHLPPTQQQQQQHALGLDSAAAVALQQDAVLWRAYQLLSFLSHVGLCSTASD
jgi:hypothetical protein